MFSDMPLIKTKQNWMLVVSFFLALLFVVFYFIIGLKSNSKIENFGKISFLMLVLITVLIMPFFEEIIFRGYNSTSIIIKRISFILLPLFLLGMLFVKNVNFYFYILLLGLIVLFYLGKIKFNSYYFDIIPILFFGFVHYSVSDFYSFSTSYSITIQFAFAFFANWLVINFKLISSIIAHITLNSILMLILFVNLKNQKIEHKSIETTIVKMEWVNKEFLKEKTGLIDFNNHMISVKNSDLNVIKGYLVIYFPRIEKLKPKYFFTKYDIIIETKDKSKLKSEDVEKILIESKLFSNN